MWCLWLVSAVRCVVWCVVWFVFVVLSLLGRWLFVVGLVVVFAGLGIGAVVRCAGVLC